MATRDLKKGRTGSDVLQLQKDLQAVGYYTTGKLDGIFGSHTDRAVRSFQKANSLKVDGIVGPKTRAALAEKIRQKGLQRDGGTVQSSKKKKKSTGAEVEIGRWNGHRFVVSGSRIFSFKGLQIKGASELESASDNKKEYVKRERGSPAEVSLTIELHGSAGCNVRNEALAFIKEAAAGASDYFYVGNKKLLPCKLMLVDAQTKEVQITHSGAWISASVQISMKQAEKFGTWSETEVKNPAAASGKASGKTETALFSFVNYALDGSERPKTETLSAIACSFTASVRSAAKKATAKKVTTVKAKQ